MKRAVGLLAFVFGCGATDPYAAVPPGTWILVRPVVVRPALDRVAGWQDTRVAAAAKGLGPQLSACGEAAWLRMPEGEVRCTLPDGLGPVAALGEGHAGAFLGADHGIGRLAGTIDVDAEGGFTVRGSMPTPPGGTAWDLVLPGAAGPGANVLPTEGALVHARVAQARVADVSTLAAKAEDDLFGLGSGLFAAAMLNGTWELALWPPVEGGPPVPVAALAVGVRSEEVARSAADEYTTTLAKRWSFQPTPTEVDGHAASCLAGLKLLPALTPCWTVRGGNLVVGWNQAALARAMAPASGAAERSGLVVDLGAFSAVDAALTAAFAPGTPAPPDTYPWRSLRLSGWAEATSLEVELVGRAR